MSWSLLLLSCALDGAAALGLDGQRVVVSAAAALARANPTRTCAPTCSVPYYTKREEQQLQQAQRALVRTVGGVLGGAVCGASLHVAADAWVPLAPWASLIDATVDTAVGGVVGAILGVLWASEAALLRTGAAPAYMRDSLRPLMQNASANESLAQITLGMSTMASNPNPSPSPSPNPYPCPRPHPYLNPAQACRPWPAEGTLRCASPSTSRASTIRPR